MNKPFSRSYWVKPDIFLAGYYPGSKTSEHTETHLRALLKAGIRTFINLMEPDEKDWDGYLFVPYLDKLQQLAVAQGIGISYYNLPIRDQDIPSYETMRRILDTIEHSLLEGDPIYLHCWGGKGRTGTVVGCWLVENGVVSGEAALELIQHLRKDDPKAQDQSPETKAQREFVSNWSRFKQDSQTR